MTDHKHTLLFVPNYDQSGPAGATNAPPVSYLRLGSVETESEVLTTAELRGDDLLALAGLQVGTTDFFEDDHRASQQGTGTLPSDANAIDGGTKLKNAGTKYYRYDGRSASGVTKSRADLTQQLRGDGGEVKARGGWRDHTDGNRIVTVRGDRVDVVMGNYKRVVFGRVAESTVFGTDATDPLRASSWEVSGGHIFEKTSTGVAALHCIEWVEESKIDGKPTHWKVVETTQKGDTVTRYSGRIEEHFNGPWQQTVIGKSGCHDEANPEIIDECWVGKHDAEVEADEVVDDTTVDVLIEIDDSRDATLTSKVISPIYDTTTGTPGTYITKFNEDLWTKDQDNLELYGFAIGFEACAFKKAGAGYGVGVTIGKSYSFSATLDATLYIGNKVGIRFGDTFKLSMGVGVEVNLGFLFKFAVMNTEFDLAKGEVKLTTLKAGTTKETFAGVKAKQTVFKNEQ
ncbi:MAG: hypothetical protein JRI23_07665 [Deltaproteobacteria bacterium]|jgi:hypothetical protein|nr:hypothetical protein [Deltaproteobacteria bacterium]MBW2531482.1 hypothetical protein [Deltaproteobacteria bacterium]